ncbi:recombinase family protein [Pedobacter rhodius]|uniref:Recombinase family protein n=1 Tax=Pedobacter rhodius TaxID=3004098 RepID=A0ABT4KX09_9SPHI|nr:recombinase family protein [Pedobacter sp. SJ11]MCZ4223276.1 recombinase family protein [Pedobacter sp. SJ11]
MKSAYIYVKVSTDEQMRQGYSLIEQEERLLQHCKINNIEISGIFREDYSAKDFNRPEWKKLVRIIKKDKSRPQKQILFIKWDRFSRNIQYAYQMMGFLKNLNIEAMAIDQPIDFNIPESIVMPAVYLSIPEAENSRRGKNTSDGLRRARKLGRWPSKAPIGYQNVTSPDGKKIIVPKQPEANHIKWSFEQMVTGYYSISKLNKIACLNGFDCKRNNFWQLMHNPIYCGFVTLSATKDEEKQLIEGIHEPLISKELFYKVQELIASRRRLRGNFKDIKLIYPLRGFLTCPFCSRKLSASTS